MKRNILIILIGVILYGLVFRLVTYLLEQLIVNGFEAVLPFIIIGQILIPFVFGFVISKYLTFKSFKSIFIVIFIPIGIFIIHMIFAPNEQKSIENSMDLFFLFLVIIVQPLFISVGSFMQYRMKKNVFR